ncbi:MBL fold metallo-hydrolase [Taklimakanibacter lacteus]|uniref:MBL fold metallo-hydrolase n=1 Tax=Taklimakanibacter lacteus TaxID=2268456 RepID=UPI000E672D10
MTIETNPVAHLRILKPLPFAYAFYDGRIPGVRLHSEDENWLDDGGFSLGTASYVLVDEDDALVYDTHMSLAHARKIRMFLDRLGLKRIRVVLSHHHLDHIAGNEAFADCEIIAHERTLAHMKANQAGIEDGSYHGLPAISPLIMPTVTYEDQLKLDVGRLRVHLRHANIHSDDATLLYIDDLSLLFAGDTLEDTVTYVAEPHALDTHLSELDRLWSWPISRILPNHGDPLVISAGGYEKTLIRATQQYIRTLKRCVNQPELRSEDLATLIAGPLQAKWVNYFAPYEAVHRSNVAKVVAAQSS